MRLGARLRYLSKQFISDLEVLIPSLEEQDQIVQNLKEEISMVEQNKRLMKIFLHKMKYRITDVCGD